MNHFPNYKLKSEAMEKSKSKQSKSSAVKPIPEGFHTVTPFLMAEGADKLIEFIQKAFNGKVTYMMKSDEGIVRHATLKIGDSTVMVSESTEVYKPMSCMLHLYVENSDAVYQAALKAGAESTREPMDEFYGDRSAGVRDAWGNQWWIATHIEDVSDEEMAKREAEFRKHELEHH